VSCVVWDLSGLRFGCINIAGRIPSVINIHRLAYHRGIGKTITTIKHVNILICAKHILIGAHRDIGRRFPDEPISTDT
jgi:hypothetical protein